MSPKNVVSVLVFVPTGSYYYKILHVVFIKSIQLS